MRDVVKSSAPARGGNVRRRRRKRNLSLYYLLIFIISALVLFILSRTVLFRINEFVITGNEKYSAAQILSAGNLSTGKNMYNINTDKVERKIMETLIYIENISVKRKLPDKMIITVEEAEPFACCRYEGSRYAVVSRSRRYLETEQASPRAELMQIYGLDLTGVSLGKQLESKDPNKISIVTDLLDAIEKNCPGKISYIDITDRTDIMLGYEGRIDVEFGSSLDYEYKLRYIKAIADELDPNITGRIIYHSASAGASFVTDEDLAAMEEDLKNRQELEQSIQNGMNPEQQDGEGGGNGGQNGE